MALRTGKEVHAMSVAQGKFKAPPSTAGKHHYNDGTNNLFLTDEEADELGLNNGFIQMSPEKLKSRDEKHKATTLARHGDENYNNRPKSAETTLKNWGKPIIAQTHYYHVESSKKYRYKNISFDSSWELALYIYAEDHNEEIERCPIELKYNYNGKDHYYLPDFLYKGKLVEIKGDHLLTDDEQLQCVYDPNPDANKQSYRAKLKCMINNGVEILTKKDVKFALDYVNSKYGRNYLKSFKVK